MLQDVPRQLQPHSCSYTRSPRFGSDEAASNTIGHAEAIRRLKFDQTYTTADIILPAGTILRARCNNSQVKYTGRLTAFANRGP